MKRYPPNPEAFWGPKSRARPTRKRKAGEDEETAAAGDQGRPSTGAEDGSSPMKQD